MALLTLTEAADYLHITVRTLQNHIRHGEIATVAMGRGEVRKKRLIHPDDLGTFLDRQRRTESCPSTNQKEARPTSTTSSMQVIDFAALREQRRSAKQKPSSASAGPKPRKKRNVVSLSAGS